MTYKEIIDKVSDEIGLPKRDVDRVYRAYWRSVREYIASLPLGENLSDEEFLKLRPNVNVPSIGKFFVTLEHYRGVKKKREFLQLKIKN